MTPSIQTFRRVAVAEAISFLILLVATYIKHANDAPAGVTVMGPIHGLLFVAYMYLLFSLREETRWPLPTVILYFLGAVIPFGGFVVERRLAAA